MPRRHVSRTSVGRGGRSVSAGTGYLAAIVGGSGETTETFGTYTITTPEMYGAERDGKQLTGCSMTDGDNTLDCPTATFTSADVGKSILVTLVGLNANGNALSATITSVNSATSVELSVAASVTKAGTARAVYGTDDTEAIRSAVDAAVAACIEKGTYDCQVVFSEGIYVVAGATVKGGSTLGNAQIPLPYIVDTDRKVNLSLLGCTDGSSIMHWNQTAAHLSGCVIYSTLVGQVADGTWLTPSVVGGPTVLPAPANNFSNMLITVDGVYTVQGRNPSLIHWDFNLVGQAHVRTSAALVDGIFGLSGGLDELDGFTVTNTNGCGLRMPRMANNNYSVVDSFSSIGNYYGVAFADHFTATRLLVFYGQVGLFASMFSSAFEHGASILNASIESCETLIECPGGSGGQFPIWIGQLNTEVVVSGPEIIDNNNSLVGEVNYAKNNGGPPLAVTGASKLRVVNQNQVRGAVTAPSLPATTVALKNPFWRDAAVNVTGGTVTVIAVDGQTTGLTAGTIIVPTGKTVTLTYSSAPTWKWTLL